MSTHVKRVVQSHITQFHIQLFETHFCIEKYKIYVSLHSPEALFLVSPKIPHRQHFQI